MRWYPSWRNHRVYVGGSGAQMHTEPAHRPVSVRDLLTHTSGITYGALLAGMPEHPIDDEYRSRKIRSVGVAQTMDEFMERLGEVPLRFQPGTAYQYSLGTDACGALVEKISGMPFTKYLQRTILEPLGMTATTLDGSPAHAVHSTLDDVLRFVRELRSPRLVDPATAAEFSTVQFASLGGIVPGVGRFDDCPWGLGTEIRGTKQPHWTGTRNSPATFGHFGGAGTLLWVDPVIDVACVALTDRPFDEWSSDAVRLWPALADAVAAEALDHRQPLGHGERLEPAHADRAHRLVADIGDDVRGAEIVAVELLGVRHVEFADEAGGAHREGLHRVFHLHGELGRHRFAVDRSRHNAHVSSPS